MIPMYCRDTILVCEGLDKNGLLLGYFMCLLFPLGERTFLYLDKFVDVFSVICMSDECICECLKVVLSFMFYVYDNKRLIQRN